MELTLKNGQKFQVPPHVDIGIMPDPKGGKLTYVYPFRILVKEKPEQIIAMSNKEATK